MIGEHSNADLALAAASAVLVLAGSAAVLRAAAPGERRSGNDLAGRVPVQVILDEGPLLRLGGGTPGDPPGAGRAALSGSGARDPAAAGAATARRDALSPEEAGPYGEAAPGRPARPSRARRRQAASTTAETASPPVESPGGEEAPTATPPAGPPATDAAETDPPAARDAGEEALPGSGEDLNTEEAPPPDPGEPPSGSAPGSDAAIGPGGPGHPAGAPGGTETDPLRARAADVYRSRLVAWFSVRFRVTGSGLPQAALTKLRAHATVSLSPDRRVAGYTLSTSGNATFDAAARAAIEAAKGQALPPPPERYPDLLRTTITVTFVCKEGRCD